MHIGTNLPKIGTYNRAVVLDAIQLVDGISRVEIATRTGLTPQTISGIVRKLLDEGLVREDGAGVSTGGKPRTLLRVIPDAGYSVGIHFDPVQIGYVVADLVGQPVTVLRKPIEPGLPPEEVIAEMAATIDTELQRAEVPRERVIGLGVGCPGPIDQELSMVISPPQLSHWVRVPLKRMLEQRTGLPVTIDNDASAAAVGERWAGAARGVANFAYLYLGTGVGGGLFLGHQIYRGSSSNAAEFGHMTIDPDGIDCYCGNRGCLETVCSPAAIVAKANAQLAGKSTLDYPAVIRAALSGDPQVRAIIDEAAAHIATAMVNVVNIVDVDLVVLGGHAAEELGKWYRDAIAEAMRSRPIARALKDVDVQLSPICADAGPIGAASLVLHAEFSPSLDLWRQSA